MSEFFQEVQLETLLVKKSARVTPDGLRLVSAKRFLDFRGYFQECLNSKNLRELEFTNFIQNNVSQSRKGVVRGLHWQKSPFTQRKIIYCLSGLILDVVVDLRKSSPTFGGVYSFRLDSSEAKILIIDKGFAHGFQALTDNSIVSYFVDSPYSLDSEMCISPLSEGVKDFWHLKPELISQKDAAGLELEDFLKNKYGAL